MTQKVKTSLVCLFFLKFITISAFETAKCDHEHLKTAIANLDKCLEEDESDTDDICSPFKDSGDCVENHLKICFEEENIKIIKKNKLAAIRKVTTLFILNPKLQNYFGTQLSESEVDSMYSTCPDIPSKEYTENLTAKQFPELEQGVRTDNNCTLNEITDINVGIASCLKLETEKAKTSVVSILTRQRSGSVQSRMCSVLDSTVGKCMLKPFKGCFTERERIFLNKELSETLKNNMKAFDELFDAKSLGFTLSTCPVFSDAKKINTTFTLFHIIVLTLISCY